MNRVRLPARGRLSRTRRALPLLALALGACTTLAPDYALPTPELPPETPIAEPAVPWWQASGDPVLAALVSEALAVNADLAVAAARLEEARAALGLARAAAGPQASLQLGAARHADPAAQPQIANRFSGQLAISYEVDFWGRYRDATDAARAQLMASLAGREALRLSLASEVARQWYALVADTQRAALARRSLDAQRAEQDLLRRRVAAGLAGEFEWRQHEAESATTSILVSQLDAARERGRHALGILLGRSPRALADAAAPLPAADDTLRAMAVPDSLPAGLPSQRLLRRPDIQAAEAALAAANARIGVARAAWFPALSLTAAGGSVSPELSALFGGGTRAFSFVGALLQPLFDSGRIDAGIDAATANRDALAARYRQTVANAFREILDALVARRSAQAVTAAETARVTALQETARIARARQQGGLISEFEALAIERSLLAARSALIEAQRAEAVAAVQVWTALGG